ncbi:ABC transporter substrate-binding protein [Nocardia flavorosea]|uniref:Extracellular solute-binding protein n=1 Tax=Nocardia flavorosea TaxID=53429 RepID=A0A846YRB5_9NOCA|nr:extracellular solute-binding protein [Nocardia flavorosea]NKY59948.1 extracellular solute-binding protein [Nocardia flavorosea]
MARFRRRLAVILGAALVAAGCGGGGTTSSVEGSWADVVDAAREEGSVLLYSSQNPAILESLKTAWNAKYPDITLEFVRGTDADLIPRIETEKRTGRGTADVHVVTDASWIADAAESGSYSQALRGPNRERPEYRPDRSIKNDRFFLDVAATFSMGWNTDAAPGGFADPRDMLDPKYTGKIGVANPAGIASYIDLYDYYRESFGADYVDRLAALKPRIYPSALGVAQALTSGEVVASPTVQPLVQEKAKGAPVDWALPEPSWGVPFYGHITATAPHPNAAQVLADFMVGPEAQAAQAIGVATALPGIPGATADAHDVRIPDPAKLTPDYVDRSSTEWQRLFQG